MALVDPISMARTGTAVTSSMWLQKLVAHIRSLYYQERTQQAVLVSFGDVFPKSPTGSHTFNVASLGQVSLILDEELYDTLYAHTCQVIVQWLGMGSSR